jgi:putative DNA primase/helicase
LVTPGERMLARSLGWAGEAGHSLSPVTAASITPAGNCLRYKRFLNEITGGNVDMQNYLQRVAGYCLTGHVSEQVLFFGYGEDQNGKSVLMRTWSGILANYHRAAPVLAFLATKSDQHTTDLAGLRGARFVSAVEVEEGRRWNEARIKALTGGDTISARFMRQDNFDFIPVMKLFIVGNCKPNLRSVNKATRRRFQLIPFNVVIPDDKRDNNLLEALQKEWPGILAWMIEGCREWRTHGLNPPKQVVDATDAYLVSRICLASG